MFAPQRRHAPAFELGAFALAPNMPAVRFDGQAVFDEWLAAHKDEVDARFAYERTLATSAPVLTRPGTCAPCLAATAFSSPAADGEKMRDGRMVPNWREGMFCGCPDRLNNRQRALLHFAQASGVPPWTRLLIFGAPEPADARFAALAHESVSLRALGAGGARGDFHLAVSRDFLQFVPPLETVLEGLAARLAEGGRLIFTVPFHHAAARTEMMVATGFHGQVPAEFRGDAHRFGWDLLEMLRAAGFRDAAAYLYWSEELGYLGAMNFLFRAVK
jgi:hypothetical protein